MPSHAVAITPLTARAMPSSALIRPECTSPSGAAGRSRPWNTFTGWCHRPPISKSIAVPQSRPPAPRRSGWGGAIMADRRLEPGRERQAAASMPYRSASWLSAGISPRRRRQSLAVSERSVQPPSGAGRRRAGQGAHIADDSEEHHKSDVRSTDTDWYDGVVARGPCDPGGRLRDLRPRRLRCAGAAAAVAAHRRSRRTEPEHRGAHGARASR